MKKYIIGNWKMHNNLDQAINFINNFNSLNLVTNNLICMIAMNDLCLATCIKLNQSNLILASEDVSQFNNGSYTGQTSASMLKDINIKYCIVGHSETRKYLNVNDQNVNQKALRCIENDIVPIICIGEEYDVYLKNKTVDFLINQINICTNNIDLRNVIIAYEPLWAIGTNITPSINEVSLIIDTLKQKFDNITILYGGSINKNNISDFFNITNLNGLLIGSASIDFKSYVNLLNIVNR